MALAQVLALARVLALAQVLALVLEVLAERLVQAAAALVLEGGLPWP